MLPQWPSTSVMVPQSFPSRAHISTAVSDVQPSGQWSTQASVQSPQLTVRRSPHRSVAVSDPQKAFIRVHSWASVSGVQHWPQMLSTPP
ncbi:MAG: hypothetical protein QM765_06345 [Myxococcales bacterium]